MTPIPWWLLWPLRSAALVPVVAVTTVVVGSAVGTFDLARKVVGASLSRPAKPRKYTGVVALGSAAAVAGAVVAVRETVFKPFVPPPPACPENVPFDARVRNAAAAAAHAFAHYPYGFRFNTAMLAGAAAGAAYAGAASAFNRGRALAKADAKAKAKSAAASSGGGGGGDEDDGFGRGVSRGGDDGFGRDVSRGGGDDDGAFGAPAPPAEPPASSQSLPSSSAAAGGRTGGADDDGFIESHSDAYAKEASAWDPYARSAAEIKYDDDQAAGRASGRAAGARR